MNTQPISCQYPIKKNKNVTETQRFINIANKLLQRSEISVYSITIANAIRIINYLENNPDVTIYKKTFFETIKQMDPTKRICLQGLFGICQPKTCCKCDSLNKEPIWIEWIKNNELDEAIIGETQHLRDGNEFNHLTINVPLINKPIF